MEINNAENVIALYIHTYSIMREGATTCALTVDINNYIQ